MESEKIKSYGTLFWGLGQRRSNCEEGEWGFGETKSKNLDLDKELMITLIK